MIRTTVYFPSIHRSIYWRRLVTFIELIRLETEERHDGDEVEGKGHEGGVQSADGVQEGAGDKHAEKCYVLLN